jgi:hypothetical protein
MRQWVGLAVVLLVLSAIAFGGGLYVRGMTSIAFTKVCKDIDSTHCKCDGVIVTHSPELEYAKERPAPVKLQCKPGE